MVNTNSHISVVLSWEAHLFIKVSVLLEMVGRCLASSTVLNVFFLETIVLGHSVA